MEGAYNDKFIFTADAMHVYAGNGIFCVETQRTGCKSL